MLPQAPTKRQWASLRQETIYLVVLAKEFSILHWLQVLHWYISREIITWHGIGFHFPVRFHGGTLSSPYPSTSTWKTQSSHLINWCPMSRRRDYFNCKRLLFTMPQTLTGRLTILEFWITFWESPTTFRARYLRRALVFQKMFHFLNSLGALYKNKYIYTKACNIEGKKENRRPSVLMSPWYGAFEDCIGYVKFPNITHFERLWAEHGHRRVVDEDVDEGVGERHDGVSLVVDVAVLPGHQLARRRLPRPRRSRQPEYLPLLLGLGCDLGTPTRKGKSSKSCLVPSLYWYWLTH